MSADVSSWEHFASTDNAELYQVELGVLAVVPHDASHDTADTARQSVEAQHTFLRERGQRGGTIVFMDAVLKQDAAARAVYREFPDPAFIAGFALVGSTAFGRAVASVFLGLSRPPVPTRMFSDARTASRWLRTQLEAQ
ncbi:MAG: hypothetical protein KC502_18240 [Myxococcales bacterium]|nr:hypothetical protein [Myxococcales bacterium]